MTEQEQLDAVMALLTAADAHPYTYGDLSKMTAPPESYTAVTVSRRFGASERVAGLAATVGWRITTRAVSRYEDAARTIQQRAADALEGAALADGTPVRFESADTIAEDADNWFSGLMTWTEQT